MSCPGCSYLQGAGLCGARARPASSSGWIKRALQGLGVLLLDQPPALATPTPHPSGGALAGGSAPGSGAGRLPRPFPHADSIVPGRRGHSPRP